MFGACAFHEFQTALLQELSKDLRRFFCGETKGVVRVGYRALYGATKILLRAGSYGPNTFASGRVVVARVDLGEPSKLVPSADCTVIASSHTRTQVASRS